MTSIVPQEQAKPTGLAALLSSPNAVARIAPFLPEGVNVERVIAAAQLAAMSNPAIAECDPKSIVLSVARVAQWGLDIGQTAHLVPYGKTCNAIPDYRGLVEMIVRSGAARSVEARVVREGDEFAYEYGTAKRIRHVPNAKSTARITHAYAIVTLRFQDFDFVVLDRDEIEAVRSKSKGWSKGELESCAGYAKKTAVRRVVNLIPKNAKLAQLWQTVTDDAEDIPEATFTPAPDRDPDGPSAADLARLAGGASPDGRRIPAPMRVGTYDGGFEVEGDA
ncbi:MAG: recombinase RecT [Phycisphaerales bacterium]